MQQLMKFIVEQPQFNSALEDWAAGQRLMIATFFFWRQGKSNQKSINGLLRSLLYQLLFNQPQLFRFLDPSIRKGTQEWSIKRLKNSISALLKKCPEERISVCLLLDGLDEFEQDGAEQTSLVDTILELTQDKHVKAIVSSRPEQPVVQRLSECKGLRLQDLTREDIPKYVEGRLYEEPLMCKYGAPSSKFVSEFINDVVIKADGVFLWARFATHDILDGLWASDPLERLKERLECLSGNLDGIFEQFLAKIHPVHASYAAKYLNFENAWSESDLEAELSIMDIAFAFHPELSSECQRLMSIDRPTAMEEEAMDRCIQGLQDLQVSIQSHCAGLLDISTHRQNTKLRHRTVFDKGVRIEHFTEREFPRLDWIYFRLQDKVGESSKASFTYLFDAAIVATQRATWNLSDTRARFVGSRMLRNLAPISYIRHEGCQILLGLEFMRTLLELGLDPNSKIKSDCGNYEAGKIAFDYLAPLVEYPTHYQRFFVYLNRLFYVLNLSPRGTEKEALDERSQFEYSKSVKEICGGALTVAQTFIEHGSERSTTLRFSLALSKSGNEFIRRGPPWIFEAAQSAYTNITEFSARTGCTNPALNDLLQAAGATESFAVTSIYMRINNVQNVLRFFTKDQCDELNCRAKRWMVCNIYSTLEPLEATEDALAQLVETIKDIWKANEDHVERNVDFVDDGD
ncbi:MAG: hypothetical protein M1831_006837 [Alyxoria varia]|nr:MAG: hypothetical protein M1831_006837 [Alyxoria varia]